MNQKVSGRIKLYLVAASLLSGLLSALSLPPISLWPCAYLGLILFFSIMQSNRVTTHKMGFLLGLSFGVGQFSLGLFWANHFSSLGFVLLVIVESLFCAAATYISPTDAKSKALALPALLCLAEYGRDNWPFGGLPIGSLALGQTNGPLINLARLGGPILIVFWLYLTSSLLAYLAHNILENHSNKITSDVNGLVKILFAVVILIGLLIGSLYAPDGGRPKYYIAAAAVQGGGKRGLGDTPKRIAARLVFRATLDETGKISPSRHLKLILLPEDVVSVTNTISSSPLTREVAAQAQRLRATLIAGFVAPDGSKFFYNKLVAFSPQGHIVGEFEKVHRVPFGEYVPDRGFFSKFVNLSAVPKDAIQGKGSGMIKTAIGKLALLISYETFFTHRGRSGVNAGGGILLVATNTASYASAQVPSQELAASRIQAVSEGRALLQAATTGYSAWITPRGQVIKSGSLGSSGIVYAYLGYRDKHTIYDNFGSLPTLAISIILVIIILTIKVLNKFYLHK